MKKLIPILILLIVIAFGGRHFWHQLPAKQAYDEMRRVKPLSLAPESSKSVADLKKKIQGWYCTKDDGMVPEALKVVGWNANLQKAVELLTYDMPAYSWISPVSNQKASTIKASSALISSADGQLHYCQSERFAWIEQRSNRIIVVLREGDHGLHQELWTVYKIQSKQ